MPQMTRKIESAAPYEGDDLTIQPEYTLSKPADAAAILVNPLTALRGGAGVEVTLYCKVESKLSLAYFAGVLLPIACEVAEL